MCLMELPRWTIFALSALLEGTARYAGLLLSPAKKRFLCCFCLFRPTTNYFVIFQPGFGQLLTTLRFFQPGSGQLLSNFVIFYC